MKKIIKLLIITVLFMVVFVTCVMGGVCYAQVEERTLEIELYDFNEEITYVLRYKTSGGYSITHLQSGVICEYDEERISPYLELSGKMYYGGPGSYLAIPNSKKIKTTAMDYFGISQEENEKLNAINESFVAETRSSFPYTIVGSDGYTLINNHQTIANYSFNIPNLSGYPASKLSAVLMLRFYDNHYNINYIPTNYTNVDIINLLGWSNSIGDNINRCTKMKEGIISYLENYAIGVNATVNYTIISPRSEIIARINANQPSIVVMTNSHSGDNCNIVYGYSGNYYKIRAVKSSSASYNVNRSYVYGGVFLTNG